LDASRAIALILVTGTSVGAFFYQRKTASQNLELVQKNGALASKEATARADAQAKAASLQEALAHNYSPMDLSNMMRVVYRKEPSVFIALGL
jgi:hypothetical protein